MLGDRVKGMKYAKEARKYGEPRSYNDWKKGAFDKKKTKYPEAGPNT